MNDIFKNLLDVCITVYLDDILIYSNNKTKYEKQVANILQHLQHHGLYACRDKYEFHITTVEYLGYVSSPNRLTMSQEKVKTVTEWPEPKKIKDIQSFLNFTNFYRCFIQHYSDIAVLLTQLT